MNPCVTRGGHSFKGSFLYYMHDKGSDTRNRIAWTHTENMLTRDPDLAWKVMAYTAKSQERLKQASGVSSVGRKCEKPVMAYSLSWHPEQNPDKDHMLNTAMESIKVLGLSEHECLIVAHRDTPHKHVHVIVNRVHPITGLVASNSHSYRKLSRFALEYAKEHRLKYSPQREENARKRENGEPSRYNDNRIQNAWNQSDDGTSLVEALRDAGLVLARGNKRLVVVDNNGKAINPVRHIENIRAKDFQARLGETIIQSLLSIDEVLGNPHEKEKQDVQKPERLTEITKREQIQENSKQIQTELRKFYRIDEDYAEIRKLSKKLKTSPWWKKLFGFTRKDKKHLLELKETFRENRKKYRHQKAIISQVERKLTKRFAKPVQKHDDRSISKEFEVNSLQKNRSRRLMGREERLDYLGQIRLTRKDRGLERAM